MPNKILVRPDGSTVRVADTDAGKLLTLGYSEQTPQAGLEGDISAGQAAYYQSPLQRYLAFAEGGDAGVSLGLTDLVFGNDDSRERARYNPGERIGGEIAGNLAATMIPGAGILKFTPAGAVAYGAERAGAALGAGSKVINSMVRGGIEGAGFGAGSAITTAQLDGSPITAEAILAGMGQGALFGGGLGALGGGIEAKLEARAARKAAEEALESADEVAAKAVVSKAKQEYDAVQGMADKGVDDAVRAGKMETEQFDRMASSMVDAAEQLKQINVEVKKAADINFSKLDTMKNKVYSQMVENGNLHYVRSESRKAMEQFSLAEAAAKEGKFEKMNSHLEKFKELNVVMQAKMGGPKIYNAEKMVGEANALIGLGKLRVDDAVSAATTMTDVAAVHSVLSKFAKNMEEFQGMTPQRLERITAAVDKLQKIDVAELGAVKEAVKNAIGEMSTGMGVKLEGTPGTQLAGLWKIMKEGQTKRVQGMMEQGKQGNLLWDKYNKAKEDLHKVRGDSEATKKGLSGPGRALLRTAQYGVGSWTARKLNIGYSGYLLGSSLVAGLVGLKGAILGTLAEKATKYIPKAAKGMQKYGSRVDPLRMRLDGQEDGEETDRAKLMEMRRKEIAESAPVLRDTLYRSVQPLSFEHPELAATMHQLGIKRFQFLMSKLPKDKGLAYSHLKSLWKPDKVEVEKFSRYYEAYHDPVGVLTRALDTGKITAEAAEGVREMNPELWTHFRAALLMRVSDPEVMKNVSYQDQVHLSLLTGINFHASMDPRFIASTQQMFTERNQPLEMNPQTQPGGGAGRPAANSPQATSAQRITEH